MTVEQQIKTLQSNDFTVIIQNDEGEQFSFSSKSALGDFVNPYGMVQRLEMQLNKSE